ncbi:hypothetical protein BBD42_25465 [Paenibacillus sp. BIHB 4019]|uniref:histidine kinase n=1 Tax=Paenibacillus sp. BIHB 4019 TaxID=1870819 RepID=A0A1B2DP14_9BACL|nr:ATP-binding protein [Paenibacillus sp. BIHB 4019]ANY69459.1 hypothetical protein BBD42_25465 [Paenibacillus sp. BIHB 4019]
MKNKALFGMLGFILLLLIGANVASQLKWDDQPEARNGVLDLSKWDGFGQKVIKLKGEWDFYPKQLWGSMAEAKTGPLSEQAHVPGNWSNMLLDMYDSQAFGYGTFHLRIQFGEHQPELQAFQVPLIRSAHRLLIDGEEIGASGALDDGLKRYKGKIKPYIAYTQIRTDSIDIFVQVANFDHATSGGIIQAIRMGPPDLIVQEQQQFAAFEFGTIAFFIVFGLYFGVLHLQDRGSGWIYLSFFFLCTALLNSVQGTRWLLAIWPEMPYRMTVTVYWLCSISILVGMFMYLAVRQEQHVNRLFKRGLLVISSAMAACILVMPTAISTRLLPLWLMVSFIVHTYILLVVLRNLRSGDEQNRYEFWSFLLFSAQALLNSLVLFGFGELTLWYFVQMIGFSIAISYLFLHQFFQAYRKNEALTLELHRVNRFKSEFMTGISEQMITPLNAMIGVAEARLHADESLSAEQIHDLRLITSVGWTMRRLVDDMMDFARLLEAGIALTVRPIHLPSVVGEVMERTRYLVFSDSITLMNTIPQGLPPIVADEQRLQQILTGLIQSALRLTIEGTITTKASLVSNRMELEIIMQGTGITDDTAATLVKMLHLEDEASRPLPYDEHLGLFLVHALVKLHQGRISVASGLAQEVVIGLSLPIAIEILAGASAGSFPEFQGKSVDLSSQAQGLVNQPFRSRKLNQSQETERAEILIVSDDSLNINVLVKLLAMDQYRVTVVKKGREALKRLHHMRDTDLVIVERILQDMSGLDVCRNIREHFTSFELPILLMTSAGYSDHAIAASQAGANDFLVKPVEWSELRVRILTLVQLKLSVGARIQMELAFLQAQIKPHFLFNTLNSIAALSKKQPEKMTDLLTEFGHYLRESFRFDSSEPLVPFERELKLVKSYLHIEKVRFEDWLTFDIQVMTELSFWIPPLTIQPLVENAVRHGIMRRADGGHLEICVWQEGGDILITVKDNGVGMPAELPPHAEAAPLAGGIGLANIDRRMKQLFGYGLTISSRPGEGTEILIRLPMEKVGIHESYTG